MKKTPFLFLFAVPALLLAGCKSNALVDYEIKGNFSDVDTDTAQVVLASAEENAANIRKVTSSVEGIIDFTKAYLGVLAPFSLTISTNSSSTLQIYDNRISVSKAEETRKTHPYQGAETVFSASSVTTNWVDSFHSADTSVTDNYAFYSRKESTVNGDSVSVTGDTTSFISTPDQLQNDFNVFTASSLINSYIATLKTGSSQNVFRQGNDYLVYTVAKSSGSLVNPAYPSDTTKNVGAFGEIQNVITLKKKSAADGYFMAEMKTVAVSYLLGRFDGKETSGEPIVYASSVSDVLFSYDSQGQGIYPEPYVDADAKKIPNLMSFSESGAVTGTFAPLFDVTASYRKEHPETTADRIYFHYYLLNADIYYSFCFENAQGTAVPTDGYHAITSRYDTISEVADHPEYFTAKAGYYDVYAFVDAKGAVTYQADYLYQSI
jgi:hypothetical protein